MSEPKKIIIVDPDFLKFPIRGNRSRKKGRENAGPFKPIKIRSEKKTDIDKTYKRRALNYIRKHQEEKYKRLLRGGDESGTLQSNGTIEMNGGKTYADEFKSDFDDSLAFLQKLTDQNSQKIQTQNSTLKQYPHVPNSTLFQNPIFEQILDQRIGINDNAARETIDTGITSTSLPNSLLNVSNNIPAINLPKPTYGCLKGGSLPTFRTLKSRNEFPEHLAHSDAKHDFGASLDNNLISQPNNYANLNHSVGGNTQEPHDAYSSSNRIPKMTPEQQRAELKQFLQNRKEEKLRVERVKRQRDILKSGKKQKRTTTRTFRVGKSKHYPRVGVLIPNKTIRTNILAKKQKIRETPLEEVRKYLIKKGLIRVGSSCPNDVLRQMYESSMMMCGEIQNHNPDNLLYNYLHNGL
jgi:hypothetical protein